MNTTKQIPVLIQLFAALYLCGCASTQTLVSAPDVTLTSVEMTGLSFSSQKFRLGFDVSNPNPFPLPVQSVRYYLRLGEHRFASGETHGEFSIPANGDGTFVIGVDLNILQQTSQIASLLRTGMSETVEYKLEGSLVIDIPFTTPINFSKSGLVSVANDL